MKIKEEKTYGFKMRIELSLNYFFNFSNRTIRNGIVIIAVITMHKPR